METKFYLCRHCGNLLVKVFDSGIDPVCCGVQMQELVPNLSDGKMEKHVPFVQISSDNTVKVRVGSEPHPMKEDHFIEFIYLQTEHGGQIRYLHPQDLPEVEFESCNERVTAVYAYCNLHGLWKTEVR